MTRTYDALADHEAAEAIVLDTYLKNAIMFPDEVREYTEAIKGTECTDCTLVMALVNALIKNSQGV